MGLVRPRAAKAAKTARNPWLRRPSGAGVAEKTPKTGASTNMPPVSAVDQTFLNGRPDGMLTAKVFNWIGHVLIAPRTQISEALARNEAGHTGIYILLGENDGKQAAYIGEAEVLSKRIEQHDKKKDGWDWDTAVLVTSDANKLNKAHVKFLEARLIEKAKSNRNVEIDQRSESPPGLSEAAVASMEAFLDHLYMVLPAVRIDMFISNSRPGDSALDPKRPESDPTFELVVKKRKLPHQLRATFVLKGGEFVVQKGSIASEWSGGDNWAASYRQKHDELKRRGTLVQQGEKLVFTENYAFKSPSAAAAVVAGRPANGRKDWKLKGTSKTYDEWYAEMVA